MKGLITKAFAVTLLFSQVAAFGMHTAAVQAVKSVLTKEALTQAISGAKVAVNRAITHPSVVQAAKVAKVHADKGIVLAKNGIAYAQPYAVKGMQYARTTGTQALTLAAKNPAASFAAGSTAVVAGLVGHAQHVQASKEVATKTADAAQNTMLAFGSIIDAGVAYAKALGTKIAAHPTTQTIVSYAQFLAASKPAQAAVSAGKWAVQSIKANPENWFLGAALGTYFGAVAYVVYDRYQRNMRYQQASDAEVD